MSAAIAVFYIGLVVFDAWLTMTFKNTFRTRLVLLFVALICLSAPIANPLAVSFVKSGALSLNKGDVVGFLHVSPLKFVPIVGLSAISMAVGAEYLRNRGLRERIYRIVNEIQGFRFETDAKRPVLVRHPTTGKINIWQAQAILDYQKREHAGYLSKFRLSLAELGKEIAERGLGTQKDLLAAFFGTQNISSIEKQLLSLAEQIGRPGRAINWHSALSALSLAVLPTVIWILGALVSHVNS